MQAIKLSRLFESSYTLPQLRLFELDETGWLKVLKVDEYALRKPRRPQALLQQVLFSYTGALMLRIADMLSLHAAGEPHYLMREVDTHIHRDTVVHATLGR